MVDIRDYINLSDASGSVRSTLINSQDFRVLFSLVSDGEKAAILRNFIMCNTPSIFADKPILYERIREYLADKAEISSCEVSLIGSAHIGFSISSNSYGKIFSSNSDLDFSIVSELFFDKLVEDIDSWRSVYETGFVKPLNATAEKYWVANLHELQGTIRRGFIDTYKIPSINDCPAAKRINGALAQVQLYLLKKYSLRVKGASMRVYRNWNSFARQLRVNTTSVMDKLT